MQKSLSYRNSYHENLHRYAGLKRFFERWSADPDFKQDLINNTEDTLKKHAIPVTVDEINYMIDERITELPQPVQIMWEISKSKQDLIQSFYLSENLPKDRGMLAWRNRQIARQRFDLGPFFTDTNIHSSMTVELSQGCSVGCWFCALSPDSFKENYNYDDNREEWFRLIDTMHSFLGDAMRSTFLYWATEPFDNPDYEKFCLDIYEACGVFPPTTTAVAHKDTERIRRFIELSADHGCWLNRFSLTSLGIMSKVHKAFSAEELAEVECLALNMNTSFAYGNAGNFRKKALERPEILSQQDDKLRKAPWHRFNPDYAGSEEYANGSICCVTGFLINAVSKKIQLISPTTASDEWPLGYIIFAEAIYENAAALEMILQSWSIQYFKEKLQDNDILRFHPWLTVSVLPDRIEIKGRFNQKEIIEEQANPSLYRLVKHITKAPAKLADIRQHVAINLSIPPQVSDLLINELYKKGFFYGC
ncbi:radical SAM family RiPP maturation amino acid epimerase [Chryseobacterium sp. LC2016-27]|uniref:radical SAM family RiPP maturation amino acid epimerase n=1 Tax=Chryseobacterium sp. LC2016-27 TaxID=2897326 RepID=UPI001E5DCFCC|nr:radical SAM family RiPP maturation amino acid epimerase [Chryseobacterium sp. LC2016-27]MCD0455138.1 radical SAM family RiPP maturation amino acid epimerase [Chryseobacterium sp. LC2016-27]